VSPNSNAVSRASLNRRDFAQVAALAAVAALSPATPAHADDPKPEEKITMAKAVEAIVRQRFGDHLSEDQIKKVIARAQNYLSGRKQTLLKNSDEPAFVFQADM
jgi:hypothetical protein